MKKNILTSRSTRLAETPGELNVTDTAIYLKPHKAFDIKRIPQQCMP